jgi:tetratricopeptide (TPR) repeat protein
VALVGTSLRAEDAAQVDRYLERLGLTDLRLVHQQQQLQGEKDGDAKASKARQLSDLYAQRLLEAADDPKRFDELVARVEKLVQEIPEANSALLQVMLLQAEYQRAEVKALHWIDEPTDAAARQEARTILDRLIPALAQRRQEIAQRIEELQARADAVEESAVDGKNRKRSSTVGLASLEREMNRLQAVLGRALFFQGWAGFFQGLVSESFEQAKPHYQAAGTAFGQLLEVDAENDKLELEPDSLGLESVWRSRALMGLAASLAAQGREQPADECFTALTHPAVPAAVRETALYWHLLALVGCERWKQAHDIAAEEFVRFSPDRTSGRTPACVLLVRAGWAKKDAPPEAVALARLGLEGLARLRQFDVLAALLAKYRPEPVASDGFYALWGKGKLVFAEAEKSKQADDYERAAAWFQKALDLPEAKDDLASAAQCRYSLAWCDYRRDQFTDAIRLFEQAAAQLKALGDDTAVQSAWMVFTCYQQLHAQTKDAKYQDAAVKTLASLKRDYPNSEQARRADLMLARVSASGDAPEAAVKALAAVSPDDPNYIVARYELAVARHQLWSKVRRDAQAAAPLAEAVRQDVDTYLAAAPASEGTRRLRAALLAVDVLLTGPSPDWSQAAAYLAKVQAIGAKLDDDDSIAAEYHYRLLQLAQHAKNETAIGQQADWLAQHAAGSPYELPGLVVVARGVDDRLAGAKDSERPQRRQEAIAAYTRLVKLLGDSSEAMASKRNALVANSKLAQYEYDAGQFQQAGQRLEEMLKAYPSDRNYLRRAGLTWQRLGEHAQALPHWTKLAAGSDSASEEWYEAKYYQLVCLAKTDPAEAGKAWRQFQLLHPNVKIAAWKDRFAELEKTTFAGK